MAQDTHAVTPADIAVRPTRFSNDVLEVAARHIAPAYAKWCCEPLNEEHVSSLTRALRKSRYRDGYQIARALEELDYIEPDELLVDELGSASHYLYDAERSAVSSWVLENNIELKHSVGENVLTPDGPGKIVSRDDCQATYCIYIEQHATRAGYIGTIHRAEAVSACLEAPRG